MSTCAFAALLPPTRGIRFKSLEAPTRRRGVRTLIYNHQLCLIDRELWPFAVRSISDWKNEYHPECAGCSVRERWCCCGYRPTEARPRCW